VLGTLASSVATAQTATQQIGIEIRPINKLAVVGSTSFVIPAKKTAGPASVSLASASYAVTTNEDNRRITVALDEAMPDGVTLTMKMDAPTGATTNDAVVLSTAPQTAVNGISRLNAGNLNISFALTTSDRAVVPDTTVRTVKVTLVSGV
jgi:hypothetical protein